MLSEIAIVTSKRNTSIRSEQGTFSGSDRTQLEQAAEQRRKFEALRPSGIEEAAVRSVLDTLPDAIPG